MALKFKGLFFTLIAIIFIVLVISEFLIYVILNVNYSNIESTNYLSYGSYYYLQQTKHYFSISLNHSLSTALNELTIYEANVSLRKYNFVNNTQYELQSLMSNGTLFGNNMSKFMGNATINYIIKNVTQQSKTHSIYINISNVSLSVFQTSPYYINATLSGIITLKLTTGSKTQEFFQTNASIPLNGTINIQSAEAGQPQEINFEEIPQAKIIGNMTAINASTNPLLTVYGTVVIEGPLNPNVPGISCTNIPVQFQNLNFILAVANASNLNVNSCGMGGLITIEDNKIPDTPFLMYANTSIFNYLQNGTRVLLDGKEYALFNLSQIKNAINKGYYFASPYMPNYLELSQGSYQNTSNAGILTFQVLNSKSADFASSSTSYIQVPSTALLQVGNPNFTFSAWINPSNLSSCGDLSTGPTCQIFNKENEYELALYSNGTLAWALNNSAPGWTWIPTNVVVRKNTWSYITLTYNGSKVIAYKNAYMYSPTLADGPVGRTNNPLRIGARGGTAPAYQFFTGSIADIQIYNISLTPQQIIYEYQQGIEGVPVSGKGIVAWYPLQGNVNDYSGYGNNGTATNVIFSQLNNYQFATGGFNLQQLGSGNKPSVILGFGCYSINNCNSSQLYLQNNYIENNFSIPNEYLLKVYAGAKENISDTALAHYLFMFQNPGYTLSRFFSTYLGTYPRPLQTGSFSSKSNGAFDFGTAQFVANPYKTPVNLTNATGIKPIPFPYSVNILNNNSVVFQNPIPAGTTISAYLAQAYIYLSGTYEFKSTVDDDQGLTFRNVKTGQYFCIFGNTSQEPANSKCLAPSFVTASTSLASINASQTFPPGLYTMDLAWLNNNGPGASSFRMWPSAYYTPNLQMTGINETEAMNLNFTSLPDTPYFNGTDFIQTQNSLEGLNNATRPFTFSVWVNPSSPNGVILDEINGSVNPGWHDSMLDMVSGNLYMGLWTSSGLKCENMGTIPQNKWTQITISYTGSSGKHDLYGYLNGTYILDKPLKRVTPVSKLYYALGRPDTTNCGAGNGFIGKMTDFFELNTSLNNTQVMQLYLDNAYNGLNITNLIPNYWRLNSFSYNTTGTQISNSSTTIFNPMFWMNGTRICTKATCNIDYVRFST